MAPRKIITDFDPKPIPNRNFDWTACRDGYDEGEPVGYGRTEDAAVESLLDAEENG